MCCFSKEAEVAATNIFARPSKGNGQFLVYSMTLKAKEDLAMILPIPTPKASAEDAVRFINLEKYPDFFEEMFNGFPKPRGKKEDSGSLGDKSPPKHALEVVQVGSFVASFVPTVKDFSRLDEQFKLPEQVWDKLPQYRDYGFAVFKLKKGEHKIHPMAFEFPRADKTKLFFPTVHIHDGKVHAEADFDHALYCQDANTGMKWDETPQPASFFMTKLDRAAGVVDGKGHVYLKRIVGNHKNDDTWV
jgi:hypothetical protein